MLAGIKDYIIITCEEYQKLFYELLDDGKKWGINIQYAVQKKPKGLAEAFLIAEEFIGNSPVTLILGDNLFHGDGLSQLLLQSNLNHEVSTIFLYQVNDPERYGVAEFDKKGKVLNIKEKPKSPKSNFAVTGIYFYSNDVVEKAKLLNPSKRGELEITDLNNIYIKEGKLNAKILRRGMTWLDTGTFDSLHEASSYIKTIESRQGLKIGCPEEIAWRMGLIDSESVELLAQPLINSGYGNYLLKLLKS
tara:strand:- start:105 stop:848 length:744 start_codon:yes stop_codon:yes gene_type:complete